MAYMTEWLLPETRKGSLMLDARTAADRASTSRKPDSETAHYDTAFNLAFNNQLNYFPWLETPGNQTRLERFGHAMTGTRQWETKEGILQGSDSFYIMASVHSNSD